MAQSTQYSQVPLPSPVTYDEERPIFEVIDQSWSIEKIAKEHCPPSWEQVFKSAEDELINISQNLLAEEAKGRFFVPLKRDIFAAFDKVPLHKVRVVIVGQDPYYQMITHGGETIPKATGLSFSVRMDDDIPVSLRNIYKELARSINGFQVPDHGDLSSWADQGVLMINKIMTLVPSDHNDKKKNRHEAMWMDFLDKVFKALAQVNPTCIYLLWGKDAQAVRSQLGTKSIILEAPHPSGFSAHLGFIGCNHFVKVNSHLVEQGLSPINWQIPLAGAVRTVSPQLESSPRLANIDVADLPSQVTAAIKGKKQNNDVSNSSQTVRKKPTILPRVGTTSAQSSMNIPGYAPP
jgi:uracil-DNA glycosylase